MSFKLCNDEETSLQAEITTDHPFFVKGRDKTCWASFDPAATELHYGISCQLLLRGDVCMLPYEPDVVGLNLNGIRLDGDKRS